MGLPTISPTVFLLGFLPTLVLGGWILLARQPEGGWQQSRFDGWTSDLGVTGFVDELVPFLPVIAARHRSRLRVLVRHDGAADDRRARPHAAGVPDEDVHDYRRDEVVTTTTDAP